MFMFFSTLIVLSLGITIIITNNPIILGIWILVICLIISLLIGLIFFSWYGFIIFLIYIGGILVIFSYFSAIQPNQYYNVSKPIYWFLLTLFNLPINLYIGLYDNFSILDWWISCIFYINNIRILIVLGFVLFLALISVVKITFINIGPLRPYK